MDITNLDDHRKVWKTNAAACAACGHEWQAVYPVGAEDVGLECPACGSGLGSVLPNKDIVEKLRGASIYKPHEAEDLCEKAADEIERLRHEFRELHRDISMFMEDGPLKQDLLETIADVLGEEK